MRTRIASLAVLAALAMPAVALANHGILVVAHNGTPEWNAQVTNLVTGVGQQKPVEVSFGSPTRSTIAAAVDRLAKRGVTEVIAVPFFLSAPISPEDVAGHVIPVRIAPALASDPVLADIILSHAQEISDKPGEQVLIIMGYGSNDAGVPWAVDLAASARRLNQTRRFAGILTIARPDSSTDMEREQIRLSLARHVAAGKRILVVPVMKSASSSDQVTEQTLQGFPYQMAASVIMSDRLVQWVAAQTAPSAR
jgi:sirohydrochlorin ferrochelatase